MASLKDGWGFVTAAGISGDVFLGLRDNTHLSQLPAVGEQLTFELAMDPRSGRYKALGVQASMNGRRVQGNVTSVRDGGWGFAESEGVDGSVMIGKRNLNNSGIESIQVGDVLEYELNTAAKGYEAVNIQRA
jgi:cold shock CspA family protein